MSVKGSSGSHTLSSPAQLPPNLAAWTLFFAHHGPFLLLHLFSLPCLPAQLATGISPSALLGDGLVLGTWDFAVLAQLLSLQGASLTLNFDHLAGISHHVQFM